MCVVIFAGIQINPLYKTGMDLFAKVEGGAGKDNFFNTNSGPGKLYPGSPTYMYKGKEVMCMCRWTPKDYIDGSILLDIVKTLAILTFFCHEREK